MTSIWPTGTSTGVVFTAPGTAELRELNIPGPLPGHVLVRTAYVGLCGTDRELFSGAHPYLAAGVSRYPLVPGHEWTGTVLAVGDDVLDLQVGDQVTGDPFVTCGRCPQCRRQRRNLCTRRSEVGVRGNYPGAAAGLFRVPEQVCTRIPTAVSLEHAVLAEPAVTVLEGLRRVRCGPTEHAAVIGTGTLGLLAVMLLRASGATVDAVGVTASGRALALTVGARRALPPAQAGQDAYDLVIEASGAAEGLAMAVDLVAPGGRIALLGTPANAHPTDTTQMVVKDLELHAVLGGVAHYTSSLALLAAQVIDAPALLDRVYPLADAAQAYAALADDTRPRPKLLLRCADPPAYPAPVQATEQRTAAGPGDVHHPRHHGTHPPLPARVEAHARDALDARSDRKP